MPLNHDVDFKFLHLTSHLKNMEYEVDEAKSTSIDASFVQANKLKVGGMVTIEDRPCKIVKYKCIKDGKHGHAKVTLEGIDIFNPGKKYTTCISATHDIKVPIVTRCDYSLINIDENGSTQLLDLNGNLREDIEIRDKILLENLKGLIEDNELIVTVLGCNGEFSIIENKIKKQ